MKTTIYRIQDNEGRGPYKPVVTLQWLDADRDDTYENDHPPFFYEFGLGVLALIPNGFYAGCGFSTLDKLYAWFSTTELERLFKMGYCIVSMEVDQVIRESSKQLLFARSIPLTKNILYMPNTIFHPSTVL